MGYDANKGRSKEGSGRASSVSSFKVLEGGDRRNGNGDTATPVPCLVLITLRKQQHEQTTVQLQDSCKPVCMWQSSEQRTLPYPGHLLAFSGTHPRIPLRASQLMCFDAGWWVMGDACLIQGPAGYGRQCYALSQHPVMHVEAGDAGSWIHSMQTGQRELELRCGITDV